MQTTDDLITSIESPPSSRNKIFARKTNIREKEKSEPDI